MKVAEHRSRRLLVSFPPLRRAVQASLPHLSPTTRGRPSPLWTTPSTTTGPTGTWPPATSPQRRPIHKHKRRRFDRWRPSDGLLCMGRYSLCPVGAVVHFRMGTQSFADSWSLTFGTKRKSASKTESCASFLEHRLLGGRMDRGMRSHMQGWKYGGRKTWRDGGREAGRR